MKTILKAALCFLAALSFQPAYACAACVTRYHTAVPPYVFLFIILLIWIGAYINFRKSLVILGAALLISSVPTLFALHSMKLSGHFWFFSLYYTFMFLFFIGIIFFTTISFATNEQKYRIPIYISVMCVCGIIFGWFLFQADWVGTINTHYLLCNSKIKEINSAVYDFQEKNGRYPNNLEELKPEYLNKIPECYGKRYSQKTQDYYKNLYGVDLSGYKYITAKDGKSYVIYCPGYNHRGLNEPYNGEGDLFKLVQIGTPREKRLYW